MDKILEYWNMFEGMLGVSPALMIPVFVFVSLAASGMNLEERFPEWRKLILGLLCIFIGGAVSLVQEAEGAREFIFNGFMLGSASALTYQMGVGLYNGVKAHVKGKAEAIAGEEIDMSEDDFIGG